MQTKVDAKPVMGFGGKNVQYGFPDLTKCSTLAREDGIREVMLEEREIATFSTRGFKELKSVIKNEVIK